MGHPYVTSRDLKIFTTLFEHKILSRQQIQRDFFADANRRRANRRLKRLSDLGFIERTPVLLNDTTVYGWSLTPKGLKEVRPELPYIVQGMELKSSCPIHDMTLYEIRKVIESKSGVTHYAPENVLQNSQSHKESERFSVFSKLNCDAVASVRLPRDTFDFAVEYERKTKARSRYVEIIKSFYDFDVQGVFYICENPGTLKSISRVEREVVHSLGGGHMIRYALLDDVLASTGEVHFTTADRVPFCLE